MSKAEPIGVDWRDGAVTHEQLEQEALRVFDGRRKPVILARQTYEGWRREVFKLFTDPYFTHSLLVPQLMRRCCVLFDVRQESPHAIVRGWAQRLLEETEGHLSRALGPS